jgi:hemophore-related protein
MVKQISATLASAAGALALALTAGSGVASADPDLTPLVETTCTYSQAEAALNNLSQEAADEFYAHPAAQSWLQAFLGASTDQRWQMVGTAQNIPALQSYTQLGLSMAGTCKKY